MIYPIVAYGSGVLRKVAAEIDPHYEGLQQLIADMFETMYKAEGVGLAAPQIGKSIRLIVIDAAPMEEDDPTLKDFTMVMINPIILEESGESWEYNEGCLSVPGLREDVTRKSKITIEYYDENFELHEKEFDGIRARIIQHEYDHLEGIVFTDHLNSLKKRFVKGKLGNISKGRVDVKYKMIFPGK